MSIKGDDMTTSTPTYTDAVSRMHNLALAARVLGDTEAAAVWASLTGSDSVGTELSFAVLDTLPTEFAPLMRVAGGIPAQTYISMLSHRVGATRDSNSHELRIAANLAWSDFKTRSDLADSITTGTGWDLSDAWQTAVEIEELERYPAKFVAQIMQLAGRMHEILRGNRERVSTCSPQEVKSVTVGGDLSLMLPREHALLGDVATADLKSIDVLQSRVRQFEVVGDKAVGRGPLVICIDESDSMWMYGNNNRNVWAKACMLAMLRIAHGEDRMVHVVHFSTATLVRVCKPCDRESVLLAMSCFLHGGTAIKAALDAGNMQIKVLDAKGHSGADVVLITDGRDSDQAGQTSTIMKMVAKGARLWTVGIAVEFGEHEPLRKYADHYVHVDGDSLGASAVAGLRGVATTHKTGDRS